MDQLLQVDVSERPDGRQRFSPCRWQKTMLLRAQKLRELTANPRERLSY